MKNESEMSLEADWIKRGYKVYKIKMARDGTHTKVSSFIPPEELLPSTDGMKEWFYSTRVLEGVATWDLYLRVQLIAKSEEQAIKVANEYRTKDIALGLDKVEGEAR